MPVKRPTVSVERSVAVVLSQRLWSLYFSIYYQIRYGCLT